MAADYFLKLDGIPGESVDAGHKGEIDVSGVGWGVSRASGAVGGGGGGAGKAEFEDLVVVARTSKASPLVWQACATGKHLASAVLTCRRRAGKGKAEFLKITLTDVVVTFYEIDGADDDSPADQFGLAYTKIETAYTPVGAGGKAQPGVAAGWDLKKNAKA